MAERTLLPTLSVMHLTCSSFNKNMNQCLGYIAMPVESVSKEAFITADIIRQHGSAVYVGMPVVVCML